MVCCHGLLPKVGQSPIMIMVSFGEFVRKRGVGLKEQSSSMMEGKFAQLFLSLFSFNELVQSLHVSCLCYLLSPNYHRLSLLLFAIILYNEAYAVSLHKSI